MAAFALYATAFLVRPVGAVVFGGSPVPAMWSHPETAFDELF